MKLLWLRSVRFFSLAVILMSAPLAAEAQERSYDVIVTAAAHGKADDVARASRLPGVLGTRPVFSPSEQRALRAMGESDLAASTLVTLRSETAAGEFNRLLRLRKIKAATEPAEIPVEALTPYENLRDDLKPKMPTASNATTAEGRQLTQFEKMQWALRNFGDSFRLALDDLTSHVAKGKVGADIGLDRLPPENPNRLIKVFTLDTGLDFGHAGLKDAVFENVEECKALVRLTQCLKAANGDKAGKDRCEKTLGIVDSDGNGYPTDCSGWDVTSVVADQDVWGNNDARDTVGHGMHVGGIVGAQPENGVGVSGVLKNVRIVPVKVIAVAPREAIQLNAVTGESRDHSLILPSAKEKDLKISSTFGDIIARGMLYALRSKAQVINMSFGWPINVESNLVKMLVELANRQGVLVVASAGNDGTDALIRPCLYEGVICVGSHDPDDAISHFSNRGYGVDIAAPGLNILSLHPTGIRSKVFTDRVGYEVKSGTSMSAPYVTGALARLLNAGFSPSEAKARLFASARAQVESPRIKREGPSFVQNGNLDLAAAFRQEPRPLVLPATKRPIELTWNRRDQAIPLTLDLKNFWVAAKSVSIEIEPVVRASKDIEIEPRSIQLGGWKAQESKSLELVLSILTERFESEQLLRLKIRSVDAATGKAKEETRYIALEVFAATEANDPDVETIPIKGPADLHEKLYRSELRTALPADGDDRLDYIAIDSDQKQSRFILLRREGNEFRIVRETVAEALPAEAMLGVVQRVDLDVDGRSDYVLGWRLPPKPGKIPVIRFRFFDSDFKPLAMKFDGKTATEADYLSDAAALMDTFVWLKHGQRRVPAWISRGYTPPAEKPAYDPWNPNPIDTPEFRLFYWGEDGLRTVRETDKTPVVFLEPSRAQARSGEFNVLWIGEGGTDAKHSISSVFDGKSKSMQDIDLGGYRRLKSEAVVPLFNLAGRDENESGEILGSLLRTPSYRASMRATGIANDRRLVLDSVLEPLSKIDRVNGVVAGYAGPKLKAVLSQTLYEFQYHDLSSGEVASTSSRRYSFLPQFYFDRSFAAGVGGTNGGRDRLPLFYLPNGLGTTRSVEVMAPRYEGGRLTGLVRPARLRLTPGENCVAMAVFAPASNSKPSQAPFFCGDHFIFTSLNY